MKPDKALEMALDAHAHGKAKAAKAHGVSERSIERANKQVAEDPVLSETVAEKKKRMAEELHDLRIDVLRCGLAEMRTKMVDADLRDVAGSYKIVSDHHEVALRVMNERPVSEAPVDSGRNQPETREGPPVPTGAAPEFIEYRPSNPH